MNKCIDCGADFQPYVIDGEIEDEVCRDCEQSRREGNENDRESESR